ncbi:MAG: hypothetical protein P1U46_04810 [Patescibacteria group bacterium]|nr:hypothetical protein [Patescibacteria group bacterium]
MKNKILNDDNIIKIISRDSSYNYLYDRYKKNIIEYKEKIYKDKSNCNYIDNLDIIIKLHYCFEYSINYFFISSSIHRT